MITPPPTPSRPESRPPAPPIVARRRSRRPVPQTRRAPRARWNRWCDRSSRTIVSASWIHLTKTWIQSTLVTFSVCARFLQCNCSHQEGDDQHETHPSARCHRSGRRDHAPRRRQRLRPHVRAARPEERRHADDRTRRGPGRPRPDARAHVRRPDGVPRHVREALRPEREAADRAATRRVAPDVLGRQEDGHDQAPQGDQVQRRHDVRRRRSEEVARPAQDAQGLGARE